MAGTSLPAVDPREFAISTRGLRKTYRSLRKRSVAVKSLDLDVPFGGVHGFLGPNGSGKTTTIRMLLGLVRADSGTAYVLGQPVPRRLPQVVSQVGAIVEQPKFFPNFSGRRNLEILALSIGVPVRAVDQVLSDVDLGARAKEPFRTYSLGMKQRLAIAATLLKDPQLLIFDEPTNGLDPSGIREVRETMRSLGAQGKTVLVSSHILAEVEQVADTVSIIGRGQLLASGRLADLTQNTGRVRVGVHDLPAARSVLEAAGGAAQVSGSHLLVTGFPDPSDVSRLLARADIFPWELGRANSGGLEDFFLQLTAGEGPSAERDSAVLDGQGNNK